jgi:uncharacterized membrane protein HdeD (DUF308 family)
MKLNKNLGMILLSIWLILHGVFNLFNVSSLNKTLSYVLPILTLLAGIVILLFDQASAKPNS